jgi:hypothetical protein
MFVWSMRTPVLCLGLSEYFCITRMDLQSWEMMYLIGLKVYRHVYINSTICGRDARICLTLMRVDESWLASVGIRFFSTLMSRSNEIKSCLRVDVSGCFWWNEQKLSSTLMQTLACKLPLSLDLDFSFCYTTIVVICRLISVYLVPLLTALSSKSPEIAYSVVCHIEIILQQAPALFEDYISSFYCR